MRNCSKKPKDYKTIKTLTLTTLFSFLCHLKFIVDVLGATSTIMQEVLCEKKHPSSVISRELNFFPEIFMKTQNLNNSWDYPYQYVPT